MYRIDLKERGIFAMKIILKIFAIPFVVVFTVLGFALTFLGWLSGRLLAFISLLFGAGGVIMLFEGKTYAGVGVLVIAFLISPFGLPALAEAIANIFHRLNGSLIGFIAG